MVGLDRLFYFLIKLSNFRHKNVVGSYSCSELNECYSQFIEENPNSEIAKETGDKKQPLFWKKLFGKKNTKEFKFTEAELAPIQMPRRIRKETEHVSKDCSKRYCKYLEEKLDVARKCEQKNKQSLIAASHRLNTKWSFNWPTINNAKFFDDPAHAQLLAGSNQKIGRSQVEAKAFSVLSFDTSLAPTYSTQIVFCHTTALVRSPSLSPILVQIHSASTYSSPILTNKLDSTPDICDSQIAYPA